MINLIQSECVDIFLMRMTLFFRMKSQSIVCHDVKPKILFINFSACNHHPYVFVLSLLLVLSLGTVLLNIGCW